MASITSHDLEKAYGDRAILGGVSVVVEDGERVGLVGANGAGKTTLARILAGVEEPDSGTLTRRRDLTLGYLEQQPAMAAGASAIDVVLAGLGPWSEAIAEHERLTAALANDVGMSSNDAPALVSAQAEAAAEVERLGGWDLRHRAASMLGHLGIADPDRPVGTMSGGERRRVALARILIASPGLAVLDEPTNHLDIPTIEWLERYIRDSHRGAILLITHDRTLLDRVVTRTLEVDRGAVHSFDGGWEEYLSAKAEREAHEARVEANRQNFLRRELEWLRRQPKARTGKQKARIGRAHEAIASVPTRGPGAASIRVESVRSGKTILEARDVAVEIGGNRVVDGFDLTLRKGQRVGIIGPNGAGKTTLLRALLQEHPLAAGTVTRGTNTRVAYLDQTRATLDGDATVYDAVADGASHAMVGGQSVEIRAFLYRFLFDNATQKQKVKTLSGGERARVALARVLRTEANLVVLDEPTNDLDVMTLSALEASLLEFDGTALVVTHDRWFLNRVATDILSFEGEGRVVCVAGNYEDYLRWKQRDEGSAARDDQSAQRTAEATGRTKAPKRTEGPKKLTYGERIELEGLMEKVEAAEAVAVAVETEVNDASFANRGYKEQAELLAALEKARAEAEALVERWTELETRAELE